MMHDPVLILDDVLDILPRLDSIRVQASLDAPHLAITATSTDPGLRDLVAPQIRSGQARLRLEVGTRLLYFLIEERSGDDKQYEIFGRSLSALLDEPHAAEAVFAPGLVLADEAAAGLTDLAGLGCDWRVASWLLPADWSHQGRPLDALTDLAEAVGARVQSDGASGLVVRPRFSVRPVDMATARPDLAYGSADDLGSSIERQGGTGCDAVQVVGHAAEAVEPLRVEVEESGPARGQTVHVRVWWPGGRRPAGVTAACSDPAATVARIAEAVQERVEETLVVEAGVANLAQPAQTLRKCVFHGAPSDAAPTLSDDGQSLQLLDQDGAVADQDRVATVTYETVYDRYEVRNHNVPVMLFVLDVRPAVADVVVTVRMGQGTRPAEALARPILTAPHAAVAAGTAYLDETRYDHLVVSLTAAYRDRAVPGALVDLQANDGQGGVYQIERADIVFDGPKVTNEMELIRCLL